MKKFITIALAIVFIVAMAIPAYAFELPDSFWDKWFKDHPIDIPSITIPPETEPIEPTEPENTEPEIIVTELSAPTISEAKYVHKNYQRLEIQWTAVENAESYLVMITKADGTILTYVTTDNILFLKNAECPKVYVEKTTTWTAASVRVMAVAGDVISEWSDLEKIGCDKIH